MLPLEKVYRLWDHVLFGSPSLPLYVAIAFLRQMRQFLLKADFNSTMLFFANMQSVDIHKCVADSDSIQKRTPPSVVASSHFHASTLPVVNSGGEDTPTIRQEWEKPVTIEQFKKEACCRVNPRDVQEHLIQLAIIIDVRDEEQYDQAHVVSAINIPASKLEAHNESEQTDRRDPLDSIRHKKGLPIVIVGNGCDYSETDKLALRLIRDHFPYISVVLGGAQALADVCAQRTR